MLVFNAFSHIDNILKDSIAKCIYSFEHCPINLPNYVDYFYCALTQSAERVAQLQVEKEVATQSPLKIADRVALFKGCLSNVSFLKRLNCLTFPIIAVHSKKNSFIQLKHAHDIFEVSRT